MTKKRSKQIAIGKILITLLILVLILGAVIGVMLFSQSPDVELNHTSENGTVYDVSLRGIKAGYLELTKTEVDSKCINYGLNLKTTNALVEAVFPIREEWVSSYNPTLESSVGIFVTKDTKREQSTEELQYNFQTKTATWTLKKDGVITNGEFKAEAPFEDTVSWLFSTERHVANTETAIEFSVISRRGLKKFKLERTSASSPLPDDETKKAILYTGNVVLGNAKQTENCAKMWFDIKTHKLIYAKLPAVAGVFTLKIAPPQDSDN